MRKLTSLILSILLIAALVIPASAAGTSTFKITSSATEVSAGDTVTLTVEVESGAECSSFGVVVEYDTSVFEFVSVTAEGMGGGFKTPHVSDPTEDGFKVNPFPGVGGWNTKPVSGSDPSQSAAVPTGKVGTVTLKVKDAAALGETTITGNASQDGEELTGAVMPVTIEVVEEKAGGLLGDADSDGYVDSWDATLISRYDVGLIGEDKLNLAVCDVDGDGYVDSWDATLISRYDVGLITKFPAEG